MEYRKSNKLTLEDFLGYNRHHLRKHFYLQPVLLFIILAGLLIIIVDPFSKESVLNGWILIGGVAVIYSALSIVIFRWTIKRGAKRQYEAVKGQKDESELVINENGVRDSGPRGDISFGWPKIYRAESSKDGIYIYLSRQQAFIVPRRVTGKEDVDTIRALVEKHLSPERNKLKKTLAFNKSL